MMKNISGIDRRAAQKEQLISAMSYDLYVLLS